MKLILLSFWVLASLWHTTFATQPTVAELADSREARLWADSVYNTLTEKQRIAQLVFPKVDPRGGANSKALIRKLVETNGVGGLLFSGGSIEQYVDMINYAQSVARIRRRMGPFDAHTRHSPLPAQYGIGRYRRL